MALRIDFYHDAADKLGVAARIAQKAHAAGHRLLVVTPDPATQEAFDRLLWTFAPLSFVPHCRAGHRLAEETPVVLANRISDVKTGRDVLINLGMEVPDDFDRFDRLIEIVGRDDDDRLPARERFRHYRNAGHEITSHRLGDKA
jgi:DNA polymerase-3 subunit chi